MALSPERLRRELRKAGIANAAVDAVWPQWWSDEAAESVSATAELTYTVARRLGLSPQALLEGSTKFLWRDETKYKKLGAKSTGEEGAVASFGVAVGRCLLSATQEDLRIPVGISAFELRQQILRSAPFVDAQGLLSTCWAFGVPVIQLRVFPLSKKRMHAMTVRMQDRYAILLGAEWQYLSRMAYVVAHELGHILLGHLLGSEALLEIDDPLVSLSSDSEEREADRYALALLTGSEEPQVIPDAEKFNATQLAHAAIAAAGQVRIEPGILSLCLGHATKNWKVAVGALKAIPPGRQQVGSAVNDLAANQLDWHALSLTSREYLATVMGQGGTRPAS